MPLTHLTKALRAETIMRAGAVEPGDPDQLGAFAYFFYGRPAYRVNQDDVVKMEAACPYCFLFDKHLIRRAQDIFAFDTGAFNARLYKHVLVEEFNVNDFSLGRDIKRPNRLINAAFGSRESYFEGNRALLVDPVAGADAWELEGRAYLHLLASPGRNEPDDRICSIEVLFADPVPLEQHLIGVVAPHTHWGEAGQSPWLTELSKTGVQIEPYNFVPGRHPEHYQTLVEIAVRNLFVKWCVL